MNGYLISGIWIVNTKLDKIFKVDRFVFNGCRVAERTVNSDVIVPVHIIIKFKAFVVSNSVNAKF